MRKIAVCLVMGMLAASAWGKGQAEQNAASGPVEFVFWNVFADNTDTGKFLADAADAFMSENPGVVVKIEGQGGYDSVAERLEAAAAGRRLPTAAIIEETFLGRFYPLAADLSKYLPADVISNYQEGLLVSSYVNKVLYTVPFNRSMPNLYYNKTMFDEMGIKAPPKTWDEFHEISQKLTDKQKGIFGGALCWDTDAWIFESILYSWGGSIISDDNKTIRFNDGGRGAEIVAFFQGMAKDGSLFNPYIYQDDPWPVLGAAFLEGKIGMFLGSNGMFSLYNQWAKEAGFELALAVQPSKDGNPSIATGAGNIIVFNDSSEEQKKAAGDFIAFLASDKYAADYTILTGYLPTTKSALKDPRLQNWIAGAPNYQFAIDQMQYAHKRPLTKNWRNIYTRLVEDLEHCLRDTGVNPASAMAEAAGACQRIVDDNP